VVEAGELPGDLVGLVEGGAVGLVEGGADGPRQSQPLGYGGEGSQDGEGVGAAHDIEVVDEAVLFPEPEAFGEKQEVELSSFGDLSEAAERLELDVAAGVGVAPHRGVVDSREMGGEVYLLDGFAHTGSCLSDGGVTVGGPGQAEVPACGRGFVSGAEKSPVLQFGDQCPCDLGEVVWEGSRRWRKPDSPVAAQSSTRSANWEGRHDEHRGVALVGTARPLVEPGPSALGLIRGVAKEDDQVGNDVDRSGRSSRLDLLGADLVDARPSPGRVAGSDEAQIGRAGDAPVGTARVCQCRNKWLPSGGLGVIDGPRTANQRPWKSM
jgi:hypothetical protein